MKKLVLALVAAAGLYAVAPAPASAQTMNGLERSSPMDANAQMMRRERMMRGDGRMERRMMMRREMMRRDRMRMERRMDRRRMMMR